MNISKKTNIKQALNEYYMRCINLRTYFEQKDAVNDYTRGDFQRLSRVLNFINWYEAQ